jgi:hypothetical protein
MRSDRLLELRTNDHTRALCGWATREQHDARSGLTVTELEQLRHVWAGSRLSEAKHIVDLLCRVVLAAAEDVRLGAFGVAKLVYLGLYMSALF